MIISRTPLRISFLGGGTDYPQFYNYHEGAVIGTSIDKYCYVTLHNGKSWFTFDLPNKSGLASSSAYTVGLIRALNPSLDKTTIAKIANTWEFDKLGGNIGTQDQFLCSLGGFLHLRFNSHGVRDKVLTGEYIDKLQDYLMLFDTHQYRLAGNVVASQLERVKENTSALTTMVNMVNEGIELLKVQDYKAFGYLLNDAWHLKKSLSDTVTTQLIDRIYVDAIKAGAWGGKILGGGGGGFIIFCVDPAKQDSVRDALSDLTYVPFKFEDRGSVIIYND